MIGTKKEIINYILDKDENIKFEIKEHKEKRSLNANSYYWSLVNQMAKILKTSEKELHKELVTKYGVFLTFIGLAKDIDIELTGIEYYKYSNDFIGKDGKKMSSYRTYKGSSLMNTKEFSHLLEMTIQDARELGIEILEDTKIQKMMEEYEKGMIK